MKRLNSKAQLRQKRLRRVRWRRNRKRLDRYAELRGKRKPRKTRRRAPNPDALILAPPRLNLYEMGASKRTRHFLAQIRRHVFYKNQRIRIDFSETKLVTAAATLNLVAELYRVRALSETKRVISCVPPRHAVVRQVFDQVGLSDLLGITGRVKITHPLVTFWRYTTDTSSDGEAIYDMLTQLGTKLSDERRRRLFVALSEALTNTVQHASLEPSVEGINVLPRRWWMFAGVHDDRLTVVVTDLGVGIPRSLPKRWQASLLQRLAKQFGLEDNHADSIKLAMELGRSRTAQVHRGKGMGQLRDAIKSANVGHFAVYSSRGEFRYQPSEQEQTRNFKYGLHGTTVEWSMPIETALEAQIV